MNKREQEIITHVNEQLAKHAPCDNIVVYAPTLTHADCARLKTVGKFTDVRREFMGYVKFTRKGLCPSRGANPGGTARKEGE